MLAGHLAVPPSSYIQARRNGVHMIRIATEFVLAKMVDGQTIRYGTTVELVHPTVNLTALTASVDVAVTPLVDFTSPHPTITILVQPSKRIYITHIRPPTRSPESKHTAPNPHPP